MCFLASLLRNDRRPTAQHVARMYQHKRSRIEAALNECARDEALRMDAAILGDNLKRLGIIKTVPCMFEAPRAAGRK